MAEKEFLTDSGYAGEARKNGGITPAAEDYLEMICRLAHSDEAGENGALRPVRIGELAEKLHVSPSSASRCSDRLWLSCTCHQASLRPRGFLPSTSACSRCCSAGWLPCP